jgi:hypothetical protein
MFTRIPDSDFNSSRIPYLGILGSRIQQQQKKRRGKKLVEIPLLKATNITELKII